MSDYNVIINCQNSNLSLMGRMAYIVMCIEAYLVNVWPDHDWRFLARGLWLFPSMPLYGWMLFYGMLLPGTHRIDKDIKDIQAYYTLDEYQSLLQQYNGITDGRAGDEFNTVLRIPYELIWDAEDVASELPAINETSWMLRESVNQINKLGSILSAHHIEIPDIHKIDFLSVKDDNAWGPRFDGKPLSIILNKD